MSDHRLNETETVPDRRGVLVGVGDTIVSAFSQSSVAELRAGTVLALYRREPTYGNPETMIEVDWFAGDGYRSTSKTKIGARLRRFMKVELPET